MSDFYADLQDVAAGLLREFKQGVVTLRRTTNADPDPATPWIPGAPTTVSYDLDATVQGVTLQHIDGTLIVASDLIVTCSVPAVMPQASDTLTIDGRVHAIKKIEQKPAAGTPVAFALFVAGIAA